MITQVEVKTVDSTPLHFTPRQITAYFNTIKTWIDNENYPHFLKWLAQNHPRDHAKMELLMNRAYFSVRQAQRKVYTTDTFIDVVTDWYLYVVDQMEQFKGWEK